MSQFRTSRNRIASFRPFLMSSQLKPKLLQKGKISGVYCDALRKRSKSLLTFGMMYDPSQPVCNSDQSMIHQEPPNQYPESLTTASTGIFDSKVTIKDIAIIRSCYIGARCTGLAFTLSNGVVEILGQWFECTGRHTLLFNRTTNQSFIGIRFHLDGAPFNAMVRNVTILYSDVFVEGTVKDAMCFVSAFPTKRPRLTFTKDTVIWIYSELGDEICVWQGMG